MGENFGETLLLGLYVDGSNGTQLQEKPYKEKVCHVHVFSLAAYLYLSSYLL